MRIGRPLEYLLWITGAAAIVAGIIVGALIYCDYQFDRAGPKRTNNASATLIFERGQGLSAIAARLEDSGVIRDSRIFRFQVWRAGAARALKAGEYAFPAGASMHAVMVMLRDGKVVLHKLTVAEGLTTQQVLRLVLTEPLLEGPLTHTPAEGTLLPDTYFFTRGEKRDALVMRMEHAQTNLLSALWPKRAAGLPIKTRQDAIILASIVEKETGIASERPRVAAVFVNRLKRGMRLQSDPTIIYGISKGEALGRGIRQSEIDRSTPYNTYQIAGLPPTPIANPGRAAIEAVLNPPDTDDLFFVADGTGGHVFAATDREHARNTARWRAIERERAQQAIQAPKTR